MPIQPSTAANIWRAWVRSRRVSRRCSARLSATSWSSVFSAAASVANCASRGSVTPPTPARADAGRGGVYAPTSAGGWTGGRRWPRGRPGPRPGGRSGGATGRPPASGGRRTGRGGGRRGTGNAVCRTASARSPARPRVQSWGTSRPKSTSAGRRVAAFLRALPGPWRRGAGVVSSRRVSGLHLLVVLGWVALVGRGATGGPLGEQPHQDMSVAQLRAAEAHQRLAIQLAEAGQQRLVGPQVRLVPGHHLLPRPVARGVVRVRPDRLGQQVAVPPPLPADV